MDKKKIIIISIIVVVLFATIIGAVVYDSAIDTCILKVNEQKYDKVDFEKFVALALYEAEQTYTDEQRAEFDKDSFKETTFESYSSLIQYYEAAKSKGVTLSEEDTKYLDEYYEGESINKERLTELGITKEDFMDIYGRVMLQQNFTNDIGNYYTLPEGTLDTYLSQYPDLNKTYDYRIMQIAVKTGEGDNEVCDEVATKAKAEEAYNKLNEGTAFEEVAKEYGEYRLATKEGTYMLVNGELESSPAVFLSDAVTETDVYNALVTLEDGKLSEIIEGTNACHIVKLEKVRNELDESGKTQLIAELTKTYASQAISSEISVIKNAFLVKKAYCPDVKVISIEETPNETNTGNEETVEGEDTPPTAE